MSGTEAETPAGVNRCRECGCTEENACAVDEEAFVEHAGIFACVVDAATCWWVGPDLCSGCAYGITVRGPVQVEVEGA